MKVESFKDTVTNSCKCSLCTGDICMELDLLCLVQDFSQTQKILMSPNNPIAYFGILRYALCEVVGKN